MMKDINREVYHVVLWFESMALQKKWIQKEGEEEAPQYTVQSPAIFYTIGIPLHICQSSNECHGHQPNQN